MCSIFNKSKLYSILLIISLIKHINGNVTKIWNYERAGPDSWPHMFEECIGEYQSPININSKNTIYDPSLKTIKMINYGLDREWNLTNNGLSIYGYMVDSPTSNHVVQPIIIGSNFDEPFKLMQFHFHWGQNDYQGSEHLIDDKKFPLELHLVHISSRNSIAVLGFLFQISEKNNTNLDGFLRSVEVLKDHPDAFAISSFPLSSLLPESELLNENGYYRYIGSLTTPPCTEGVIWTVFQTKINISSSQMESFRSNLVKYNFRDPQKIYSRSIFSSKKPANHIDHEEIDIHHFLIDIILSVFNPKTYIEIFKSLF